MSDLDSASDNESPTMTMGAPRGASSFTPGGDLQFDDDDNDRDELDQNEIDDDLEIGQEYNYVNSPAKVSTGQNTKKHSYDYVSAEGYSTKKMNTANPFNTIPFENDNDDYMYDTINNEEDLFENNGSLRLSQSTPDEQYNDQEFEFTKQEQLKMIYMRSYINKVEDAFDEKDKITQSIRQEIINCKQRMESLEKKRDDMFKKLENETNITKANRLDAEHSNICQEIELETRVLEKLNEAFSGADYERSKALLEKTKYQQINGQLKKNEEALARQKESNFSKRLNIEDRKIELMKKSLEKSKQLENERVEYEIQKQKQTIEKAKLARKVTSKYLQETLRQMKEQGSQEEVHFVQTAESKRKDLLNLKHVIDHNKEMFQSKVAKNIYLREKKQEQLDEEKREIIERGENPNFYIPRKIKQQEVEDQKRKFEEEQKINKQEIVKKILTENQNLEKKKILYPNLFNINLKPLKPIKNKDRADLQLMAKLATSMGLADEKIKRLAAKKETSDVDDKHHHVEHRSFCDSTTIASRDDDDSDFDELGNQEEVVYKPEFDGLWNKQFKKYNADDFYKQAQKFPPAFKSKSEKELYLKSLDKLKKSAVREQVAAGKKFQGPSFKSFPQIIHFKDFDIGETYNIKVVLTNISYTINTCKMIDMTERLKDFISIDFKPPGQLSAGLTCELNVKFEPKINKDLSGEINFLASNGPFCIPISCTVKKCELNVNSDSVYFGTTVIGENLNRKIQLINKGALGTMFKLMTLKEFEKSNELVKESPKNEITSLDTTTGVTTPPPNDFQLDKETSYQDKFDELKIGSVREGTIGPFSTIELDFVFFPSFPGKFNEQFVLKFEDENSKEIFINAKATAIDVPIWIENLNIDLKICMYDRLYQDVIRVHNRANTALRITFEIPNELKNHLEILPKTAFIQAKSEFSAQVKFTARTSLTYDAEQYFDSLTGVLEVPLFIKVADQNNTVNYNLHAVVTTSDLEFDVQDIDFGHCTIYETSRATVKLTNKSILCQPFGFIKLPSYVNVQPNDGFGTLLPNETIPIDINFCPDAAKEFEFKVVCKSLVNRDFVINCRGVGVHPPLKLSAQRINFKATALNSTNYRTVYVVNEHLDYEQHRHPVPRIGTSEFALVGPTYFEFDLPEKCPFMLSPSVGCVEPGKKTKITIEYKAELDDIDIRKEAARLIKNRMTERANKIMFDQRSMANEEPEVKEAKDQKDPKKNKKIQLAATKSKPDSSLSLEIPKTPDLDSIEKSSLDFLAGHASALSSYKGALQYFEIPCYISTVSENQDPTQPIQYNIHNTLYLNIVCPTVKPEMIILSKEQTRVDFGKVPIGQKCIKKIGIKNISDASIELDSNILNPAGPFVLLNALKPIEPGEIHNLIVAFVPNKSCIYQEVFELRTKRSNLNFVFKASGVEPSFSLSFEGNLMDFGYCLASDKVEKSIEMKNNSHVPIDFKIALDSFSADARKECELKRFLNASDTKYRSLIGPNNYSGFTSFDINPTQGTIHAGSKVEIKVIFTPDHTSELYSDTMKISLTSADNSKTIQLCGKSRTKNIYIKGVEQLTANANTETMTLVDVSPDAAAGEEPAAGGKDAKEKSKPAKADKNAASTPEDLNVPIPILVTLYSISKNLGDNAPAEKIIHIGCMKSPVSNTADKKDAKKNGEFTFDNPKDINLKGFNVDLLKSAVESGGERAIKITWKPPPGTDPKTTVQTSILLTTKANVQEVWKLILQGRIVSENQGL